MYKQYKKRYKNGRNEHHHNGLWHPESRRHKADRVATAQRRAEQQYKAEHEEAFRREGDGSLSHKHAECDYFHPIERVHPESDQPKHELIVHHLPAEGVVDEFDVINKGQETVIRGFKSTDKDKSEVQVVLDNWAAFEKILREA